MAGMIWNCQTAVERMAGMYHMEDLLTLLQKEGAEELRLASDIPPMVVTGGKPRSLDTPLLRPDELDTLLNSITNEEQRRELEKCGDVRFIFTQNSTRFAVTAIHSSGALRITIRNLDN